MPDQAQISALREQYPELFKDMPGLETETELQPLPEPRDPEEAQDQLDALSKIDFQLETPEEPEDEPELTDELLQITARIQPETIETSGPGFVVFWSVEGGANRKSIEAALAITGHTDIINRFPKPPSPTVALQRAKVSVQGHVKGIIFRNVGPGEVAVVSETSVSTDGKCDYEHGVSVSIPRESWMVSLDINSFGNIDDCHSGCVSASTELCLSYSQHKDRIEAADMSVWLTECIDAIGAVTVRPRGGVYFVPAAQGAELMKIKACAETTGCAQIYVMSLATDEITSASVAAATSEAFLGDFKDIESDVSNWTQGLADSKRPTRGFNTLTSQLNKLKDRVCMYDTVLAAQKERLEGLIQGASSGLQTTFDDFLSNKGSES